MKFQLELMVYDCIYIGLKLEMILHISMLLTYKKLWMDSEVYEEIWDHDKKWLCSLGLGLSCLQKIVVT